MIRRSNASRIALMLLGMLCCLNWRCARADAAAASDSVSRPWSLCPDCDLVLGAGTTFFWHWTDGIVVPAVLEIDDGRYELGAFRLATDQYLKESGRPPISAHPYWGFSAMRRWQILHRSKVKLYLGLGVAYRTETDLLVATKFNFSLLFAIRDTVSKRVFLELSLRHWSNAWMKMPDRGEDIVMLGVGFH